MTIVLPPKELKRKLRACAERMVGPIAVVDAGVRRMSPVWRLETVDDGEFYLKRHEGRLRSSIVP